jgi:hypothetical protein
VEGAMRQGRSYVDACVCTGIPKKFGKRLSIALLGKFNSCLLPI